MPITPRLQAREDEAREEAALGSPRRGRVNDHIRPMPLIEHLEDPEGEARGPQRASRRREV